MKTLRHNHPILTSLVLLVMAFMSLALGAKVVGDPYLNTPQYLLTYVIPLLLVGVILGLAQCWSIGAWRSGTLRDAVRLGWPVLLTSALLMAVGLLAEHSHSAGAGQRLLLLIAAMFLTATFEEFIYRGFILAIVLPLGRVRAVIVSSLIFALSHLANLISQPEAVITTGTQVVYTFFLGVLLASIYLRTRNIWLVVGLHMVFNVTGSLTSIFYTPGPASGDISVPTAAIQLVLVVPLFIGAIRCLKKSSGNVQQ